MKTLPYEKQLELVQKLGEIAEELGWQIAMIDSDEEVVTGLILGTEQFISDITQVTGDLDVLEFDEAIKKEKKEIH